MKNGHGKGEVLARWPKRRPKLRGGGRGLGITEGGIKRDAGKLNLLMLEDLDARTRSAKAASRLVADLVADMGGETNINAAQHEIIRRAAIMGAICGDLEVSWLTTKEVDLALLGTLAERQRRLLECLGLNTGRKPRDVTTPSLRQYLNGGQEP